MRQGSLAIATGVSLAVVHYDDLLLCWYKTPKYILASPSFCARRKVDGLPNDYEGIGKAREWLVTLNAMRAADELSEDQARQLLHDLDTSYSGFFRYLEMTHKP